MKYSNESSAAKADRIKQQTDQSLKPLTDDPIFQPNRRFLADTECKHAKDLDSNNAITASMFPTTSSLTISKFAILGDSTISLATAFFLLIIAIAFQQYISLETQKDDSSTTIYHNNNNNNLQHHQNRAVAGTTTTSATTSLSQATLMFNEFTTYESLGPLPDEIIAEQNDKNELRCTPKIYQMMEPLIVTPEMMREYHRDGVICMRGLISDTLLQHLDEETISLSFTNEEGKSTHHGQRRHRRSGTQFHTVIHSALFRPIHHTANTNTTGSNKDRLPQPSALMEVALWSNVSIIAASLLQLSSLPSTSSENHMETLRVIRDIFLAKDDDPYVCGWHVDDFGFWPALPHQSTTSSSSSLSREGINAWIALDDMLITEETGGFALAVQSHTAPWNYTAFNITGAPTVQNFPYQTGGYHNVSHMFQERIGYGTCNIERTAPHIHQRMEEMKRIYSVRKGDVIFHTRYLFHRTVPITSSKRDREIDSKVFRRYSIRYGMGSTTVIPPGYGTELSVLYDPNNGGLLADQICSKDQIPWYPQAYPHMTGIVEDKFWKEYATMLQHHIPIADQRLQLRKQEMRPYLRQLAHEQAASKKH